MYFSGCVCLGIFPLSEWTMVFFPTHCRPKLPIPADPSEVSRELSIARCVCLRSCHHPSLLVSLLAASATYEMELDGLFYELCSGGDLLSLLVKARQHLPQRVIKAKKNLVPALVSFAMQIAAALVSGRA